MSGIGPLLGLQLAAFLLILAFLGEGARDSDESLPPLVCVCELRPHGP